MFKQNLIPIKRTTTLQEKGIKHLEIIGEDKLKNKSYSEAIQQMIESREAEEIHEESMEARNIDRTINYLPRHGVFKFGRISTKCLIVFDAIAKSSEGVSLASNLLPGPKRQLDIILVLINFRLLPYTLVEDISRMFYCIILEENIETITGSYGMMTPMRSQKFIDSKDSQWDQLILHF